MHLKELHLKELFRCSSWSSQGALQSSSGAASGAPNELEEVEELHLKELSSCTFRSFFVALQGALQSVQGAPHELFRSPESLR